MHNGKRTQTRSCPICFSRRTSPYCRVPWYSMKHSHHFYNYVYHRSWITAWMAKRLASTLEPHWRARFSKRTCAERQQAVERIWRTVQAILIDGSCTRPRRDESNRSISPLLLSRLCSLSLSVSSTIKPSYPLGKHSEIAPACACFSFPVRLPPVRYACPIAGISYPTLSKLASSYNVE